MNASVLIKYFLLIISIAFSMTLGFAQVIDQTFLSQTNTLYPATSAYHMYPMITGAPIQAYDTMLIGSPGTGTIVVVTLPASYDDSSIFLNTVPAVARIMPGRGVVMTSKPVVREPTTIMMPSTTVMMPSTTVTIPSTGLFMPY